MLAQNINRPLDQEVVARNVVGGLNAAVIGSVDTAVLRFDQAAVITGPAAFITATNSATQGTQVAILKSGVYAVKLYLQGGSPPIDVIFAISQDVAAAGLTLQPSFATPGFVEVQRVTDATVGTTWSLEIETDIIVSPEQEGTGSIVRFQATGPAGVSPLGDLLLPTAYYSVERTNQAHV